MPRIFVIGGPNGAGKTTIAGGLLPEILECDEYVNADAIAKALSPSEAVVKRRYGSGIRNFLRLYVPIADQWVIYDNSGRQATLVARSIAPGKMQLLQPEIWRKILAVAG